MAKQLTEDEQSMKRRARRRLIGAVAFTLAVVVVLPMLLDSEPRQLAQDIELRIPSPDKVGEFVPGSTVSEPVSVPAATLGASPPTLAASTSGVASETLAMPTVIASSATLATSTSLSTPPADASAVPPTVQAKSAEKPAREEAFVAQVGAYTNPDTARQEAERLKKFGFRAYTEKMGDKTRVRVGPYPDRAKAEKARRLLEKHGLHPVVTSAK